MKIVINEKQLKNKVLLEGGEILTNLPSHLIKLLKCHKTSLGKHPSFPNDSIDNFDEKVTIVTYNKLLTDLKSLDLDVDITDENALRVYTQNIINEIMDIEKPVRNELERLCGESVLTYFNLINNREFIDFKCELKDVITPREINCDVIMDVDDLVLDTASDINVIEDEIYKRRMILSLIAGASQCNLNILPNLYNDLFKINIKLPELYYKVTILIDYLNFISKDDIAINDNYLMSDMGGELTDKFHMVVEAKILPLLLKQSINCILYLLSTSVIPYQDERGEYIIKNSDNNFFSLWDERLGISLWGLLTSEFDDSEMMHIPDFFLKLIKLSPSKFFELLKEVFLKTKRGKTIITSLLKNIKHNKDYNALLKKINDKSNERNNYLKIEEL